MVVFVGIGEAMRSYITRHLALYIALLILLGLGVGFGAVATQSLSEIQRDDLIDYVGNVYSMLTDEELNTTDRSMLVRQGLVDNLLKTTGLMWLLGLTVVGAPFVLGIVFLRGFILGFTIGFIIEEMQFSGIILATTSVIPHHLLIVPAIILGAGAALTFASSALKIMLGVSKESVYNQFATTTVITVFCGILLALAVYVETYITPALIHLTRGFLA